MIVRARGKLLARALALLFAAAIFAQLLHVAFARELVGSEAPDFALKAVDGKNFRLSEYRSEVVAVVFVASWCGDCREILPELERLQRSLGGEGLQVLGVSFDEDSRAAAAADAARAASLSFPLLVDGEGEAGRLYDVGTLPAVALVDREGKLRNSISGARSLSEQALTREIRALLAE